MEAVAERREKVTIEKRPSPSHAVNQYRICPQPSAPPLHPDLFYFLKDYRTVLETPPDQIENHNLIYIGQDDNVVVSSNPMWQIDEESPRFHPAAFMINKKKRKSGRILHGLFRCFN